MNPFKNFQIDQREQMFFPAKELFFEKLDVNKSLRNETEDNNEKYTVDSAV